MDYLSSDINKESIGESMKESLLQRFDSDTQMDYLSSDVIEELLGQEKELPCEWWAFFVGWEFRQVWNVSASPILISVFSAMFILVTQMFVGHLGALELAGASVVSIETQGLATMIMFGMAIAVQTQCGEAYATKKYASLGIICQKAMIMQLGVALIFSVIHWYSGAILHALSLTPSIVGQAQMFARGLIPQLYAMALNLPMQRFLQAQTVKSPLAYIVFGVFLLHIFLTWLVVSFFNYGLLGAALTLSLSWWIMVIITASYIIFSPTCQKTWTGFSTNTFKDFWSYAKLMIESIGMTSTAMWYTLGLVIVAGYLPNPTVSIDSSAICLNYLNWDLVVMLGLSAGASIRVQNELNAAHPRVARLSALFVIWSSILMSLVFVALILTGGTTLIKAFTKNDDVIKGVSSLTPLLAITILINGIQPTLSGVAIGCGRANLVVCVYLVTCYIVGLTIALVLGFMMNLGVAGLLCGIIIGFLLQSIFLVVLILKTDWDSAVGKARARSYRDSEEESLA